MNRHLSRIIVMQTIYEWDFRADSEDIEEIKQRNISSYNEEVDLEFIKKTTDGIIKEVEAVDNEISKSAPEWPIEQIAPIDKAILRLAVYELKFLSDVPPKVVINEAVELSKSFGGENSSKFINGVLGTIYRSSERYNPEDDQEK
ncbi:MAG: transcription antitermination factor NusB [Patescibacteria group bacterium]